MTTSATHAKKRTLNLRHDKIRVGIVVSSTGVSYATQRTSMSFASSTAPEKRKLPDDRPSPDQLFEPGLKDRCDALAEIRDSGFVEVDPDYSMPQCGQASRRHRTKMTIDPERLRSSAYDI